jgi:hypothetical protein
VCSSIERRPLAQPLPPDLVALRSLAASTARKLAVPLTLDVGEWNWRTQRRAALSQLWCVRGARPPADCLAALAYVRN